ncbi:MAG: hypothetical protein H0W88_06345 [Parachlamydiaceae bacterium]|nr:hypothetical protein [Parachlamydiaceae bacterium]
MIPISNQVRNQNFVTNVNQSRNIFSANQSTIYFVAISAIAILSWVSTIVYIYHLIIKPTSELDDTTKGKIEGVRIDWMKSKSNQEATKSDVGSSERSEIQYHEAMHTEYSHVERKEEKSNYSSRNSFEIVLKAPDKRIILDDGSIVDGDLKRDNLNGKGSMRMTNNDLYQGNFINGKLQGEGEKIFAGGTYVGGFVDSIFHGEGTLTTQDKKYVKIGTFNMGIFTKGSYSYEGTLYEGLFKDDQIVGKGKKTLPNGDVYEGEFANDKLNGIGSITYKDGTKKLEGLFKDDQFCPLIEQLAGSGQYQTQKLGNLRHGYGKFTISTTTFEGIFINNEISKGIWKEKTSKGTLTFEGHFVRNSLVGEGKKTLENGDEYIGYFKSDNLCGKGIIKYHNGTTEEGFFENDILVNGTRKTATETIEVVVENGKVLHNGMYVL